MERKARYLPIKAPTLLLWTNEGLQEAQIRHYQEGFVMAAGTAVQSFVSKDDFPAICWQSQQ